MKTKNWKSLLAFLVFIGAYVFSIVDHRPAGVVEITGYIALYSAIFMMFRSEVTSEIFKSLVDKINLKRQ